MGVRRLFAATVGVLLSAALAAPTVAQTTRTSLVIHNGTDKKQTVGVILAALDAPGGTCDATHPPVTADQLKALGFCSNVTNNPTLQPYAGKCTLELAAGATLAFPDIPNTCISGNVTFGGYASCPGGDFSDGTTTAEFTLNPKSGADEVIDVSLVNGYSGNTTMSVAGGGGWSYGSGTPISEIVPKALGGNVGNPGVFPKNCTDCTRLVGNPVCPGFDANPTCQNQRICNVRRTVTRNGGTVTITLAAASDGPQPGPYGVLGPLAACAALPTDAAADFFANIDSLQELNDALTGDAGCPSFCRRAQLACTQVAQLARRCLDRERVFSHAVARRACAADDDPWGCLDDLWQTGAQDRAATRADFSDARAFCRGDVLDACLARCSAL